MTARTTTTNPFELDSDTDSINTTTTAASVPHSDGYYDVERVLAETVDQEGEMKYLLKWEGYPLHRCSWEPRPSEAIMRQWEAEKLRVRRGEKQAFKVEVFDLAVEQFFEEKADKKTRRKAKRRRRGEVVSSTDDDDDQSEDESPSRAKGGSLFVDSAAVAAPKQMKSAATPASGSSAAPQSTSARSTIPDRTVAAPKTRGNGQQRSACDECRRKRVKCKHRADVVTKMPIHVVDVEEGSEDELYGPEPVKSTTKARLSPPAKKGVARPVAKRKGRATVILDDDDDDDEDYAGDNEPHPGNARDSDYDSLFDDSAPLPIHSRIPTATEPVTKAGETTTQQTTTTSTKPAEIIPAAKKSVPTPTSTPQQTPKSTTPRPTATSAKRSSVPNIFASSWGKEKVRKQGPRVSGDTPRDSTGAKFTHLSIQHRYQKYGRDNEPAPDPGALVMVDPKTGATQPPKTAEAAPADSAAAAGAGSTGIASASGPPNPPPTTAAPAQANVGSSGIFSVYARRSPRPAPAEPAPAKVAPTEPQGVCARRSPPPPPTTAAPPPSTAKTGPTDIHSVYGRRSPPPANRQRSPTSPRRPSLPNRTSENRVPSATSAGSAIAADNHASLPRNKKDITCLHWQSGTCRYSAKDCWYAHEYLLESPQPRPFRTLPKKRVTCFYWRSDPDGCNRSAEKCGFAHWDTGEYAGPPGSFRQGPNGPDYSNVKESDMRLMAAASSTDAVFTDVPEQRGRQGRPPSMSGERRPSISMTGVDQVADTEPPRARADSTRASDRVIQPVPSEVINPPSETDTPSVAAHSTSPAKDPRLRGRTTTIETEMSPVESSDAMDIDTDSDIVNPEADMLKTDLEMARFGINDLDAVDILGTVKHGAIENVFIHMPPKRHAEMDLLVEFFTRFSCKVRTSKGPDMWNFFRRTHRHGDTCLLVVHPSEHFAGTMPDLHAFLMKHASLAHVYSIGVQRQQCILEQRALEYAALRIFPHGGMTFISDDVFVYYPEKATEIINRFLELPQNKHPGAQLRKIAARPGIKDWMLRLAKTKYNEHKASTDANGNSTPPDLRWITCYDAICRLCPMEDEDPFYYPHHSVPLETSHLWSPWEGSLPDFQGRWEKGDEAGATDYMANLFAGEACASVSRYRKFLFVYQRPEDVVKVADSQGGEREEVRTDPRGWMKRYSHVGVVTPDRALGRK